MKIITALTLFLVGLTCVSIPLNILLAVIWELYEFPRMIGMFSIYGALRGLIYGVPLFLAMIPFYKSETPQKL